MRGDEVAIGDLLAAMREGRVQRPEQVAAFVDGVVGGGVSRPQAAAWLAWAVARGLTDGETVALTEAMTTSGRVLAWPEGAPVVDKHSTGGVGDTVSLVLAPLWAALGWRVPMLSGRGLAHTGGTLDKLEAIPGFRTDLDADALADVLDRVGCFISGQTRELAPADRVLYGLRDEIAAVPDVPLIVASILSKKRAAGVRRLVLDVKVGRGAFMTDLAAARELAEALVEVGRGCGLDVHAVITDMDAPLGRAVGHALEVREAVACLRGGGPHDLREVVLALTPSDDAAAALDDGRALARFEAMVAAQGGDPRALDDPERLDGAGTTTVALTAPSGGVPLWDALAVGRAVAALGGGRTVAGAAIDRGVGVVLRRAADGVVVSGAPVATVHHRDGHGLDEALERLRGGLEMGAAAGPRRLVHARVPDEEVRW